MVTNDAQIVRFFIKWNGARCPCCREFLRIKTHDAKTRKNDIKRKIAV
jgi:hypothetical protein